MFLLQNVCCSLPTPMTLASGGVSPIFPLVVHQPAFPVTLAGFVHKSRGDNVVRMWLQLRDDVGRVCECYRGGTVVIDVIWAPALCKYD